MGKNRTTKTEAEPWKAAQPALQEIMSEATRLYNDGGMDRQVYQGPRVAGFTDTTRAAMSDLAGGSSIVDPATATLTSMFDEGRTYRDMDLIRSSVADDVKAQLGSTFSGGSINSSLAQDTYTRAMSEALAGVEYDAYNDAENRRLQALGLAPGYADMERADAKAALGVGAMEEQKIQAILDADMARFDEGQNTDLQALQAYAQLGQGIGGMGGTSTKTEPVSFVETLSGIGRAASGLGGFWGAVF